MDYFDDDIEILPRFYQKVGNIEYGFRSKYHAHKWAQSTDHIYLVLSAKLILEAN